MNEYIIKKQTINQSTTLTTITKTKINQPNKQTNNNNNKSKTPKGGKLHHWSNILLRINSRYEM